MPQMASMQSFNLALVPNCYTVIDASSRLCYAQVTKWAIDDVLTNSSSAIDFSD